MLEGKLCSKRSAARCVLILTAAASTFQAAAQATLGPPLDMILDSQALHLPANASYDRAINGLAFQDAPLVSRSGYQYAVWYAYDGSPDEHVYIARRDLRSDTWESFDTGRSLTNGDDTWDAHNVISLGISGDGRLHLAYDMHADTLQYFNSAPGVALDPAGTPWNAGIFNPNQNWLVSPDKIVTKVTYPEFSLAPDGDLTMTYRNGGAGNGDVFITTYDTVTRSWNSPHQILNRSGTYTDRFGTSTSRNGYLNALDAAPDGSLHITWTWRELSTDGQHGGNHDILYAYSEDGGNSWKNNAGTTVATVGSPIKVGSPGTVIAEMDRGNSLMNQQGQVVDREGRVHVLMFHRRDEPGHEWQTGDDKGYDTEDSAHYHYYRDPTTGTWTRNRLPVSRRIGSRPSVGYDRHGNVYAAYISPDAGNTGGYQTEGDLIIARATRAAGYADWTIVHTDSRDFISEPFIDQDRLANDDVLSLFVQEYSLIASVSGSPLHVLEFDVQAYDFGDAPDPGYPTLLASDGARHRAGDLYLGTNIDAELDGQPDPEAAGDDVVSSDDEDGVYIPTLSAGSSAIAEFYVSGGSARIDAWIDFNADGDWNDPGERVAYGHEVGTGSNELNFAVPADAVAGDTYARVRLSTRGVDSPAGLVADGEVEDERVRIAQRVVSVTDVQADEGDAATRNLDFVVTLNLPGSSPVFFSYATQPGSADTADFEGVSGTVEIPAGATQATVSVPVHGDAQFEPDEDFFLSLSDPVGAALGNAEATGTILNDDPGPGTLQLGTSSYSVSESAGALSVTVTRSGGTSGSASVKLATSDGNASGGIDYSPRAATLSWADGEAGAKSLSIPITADSVPEPDETLWLSLSDAQGAFLGSPATAIATIVDDDEEPRGRVQFSSTGYSVDGASPSASVTLVRSGGSYGAASVKIDTYNGTAIAGEDYTDLHQTVIWADGDDGSKVVNITLIADAADEPDETVNLTLSGPVGVTLGEPAVATLLIRDDDDPPAGTVQFGSTAATVTESAGTASMTVTRAGGSFGAARITVASANGTAISGSDYTAVNTVLEWADGDASPRTVNVPILDDVTPESAEAFSLTLIQAQGVTVGGPSSTTIHVSDNDATPAPDTTPAAFSFKDLRGVTPKTFIISNTVTVSGLSPGVTTPIRIASQSGTEAGFSVNSGPFVATQMNVKNGDKVVLRNKIPSSSGKVNVKISIGDITDTWTIRTAN